MKKGKINKGILKKSAICIFMVVLALFLCGCMKMHIDIVWREDNSATIDMTVGIQKAMLEMMGSSEEEMQEQFRESLNDEDFDYKPFSDSEYTGVIGTMKVDDITKNTADAVEELQFRCTEEGKKKTYTVSGSLSGSDLTAGNSELEGVDIDMKFSIVMPGTIVSHNATEKSGNKLIWDIGGGAPSIQATSESGGGGGMLWLWIAIGAVVVVGGVVLVLLLTRKKKADPQAGQYHPGADAYAGPAPGYNPNQPPVAPPQQQAAPPAWGAAPGYNPPNQPPIAPPPQQAAPPAWGAAPGYDPNQPPVAPPPQQAAPPAWGAPPAPSTVQCWQCGKVLPEGTKFCNGCGAATTR